MVNIVIHGSANSSFVRTARMACEEKGVAYDLREVGAGTFADLKSDEHRKRHPFGRIPAMEHGDFRLFESAAIARYVDEAFEGPALQPADFRTRAVMTQWISAINHYFVKDLLFDFVAEKVFGSPPNGEPDEAKIEAAKPRIRTDLEILDRHLEGQTFLAGEAVSIADLCLVPIAHYVGQFPDGLPLFEGLPNVERWWNTVSGRDSFKATVPPMLTELAA